MSKLKVKILSIVILLAMLISVVPAVSVVAFASESGITEAEGWFESAYAVWAPVSGADGYNAYISEGEDGWTKIDSALVREYSGKMRVDAVGLKPGDYRIKIVPTIGEV